MKSKLTDKSYLTQLFTKPKDEVSLLLIGTEITDNELNEELGGYEHISNGFPMALTNWKMINYLEKSIDPPNENITADWLDGIVVAMNCLNTYKYVVLAVEGVIERWVVIFCVYVCVFQHSEIKFENNFADYILNTGARW